MTQYDRLTDMQVKIILDGVKNDVDYDVIAKQVGFSHKKRVSEFLIHRMVNKFADMKEEASRG